MPVTKTAKRALKVSRRKRNFNKELKTRLEIAIRLAERSQKEGDVIKAISLVDTCAKRKLIHKNKAARIKSKLSKLMTRITKAKPLKKSRERQSPQKK